MKKLSSPRQQVEYLSPAALKSNPSNARKHPKKQIGQVAASIKEFGFVGAILVDKDNQVIAGHCRLLAATQLGLPEVPVIRIEHLTDTQARAFMIADNQLTLNSEWDEVLLAENFKILSALELDVSLDITGFELPAIDLMIQNHIAAPAEPDEADQIPIVDGPRVTRQGDLWILGKHRLYCGSALKNASFQRLMDGKKAALVFIDPPYNLEIASICGLGNIKHSEFAQASGEMTPEQFTAFLQAAFALLIEHSKDGSLHYICMDWRHLGELLAAGRAYTGLTNTCIWVKDSGGMGAMYRSRHELILLFKNGNKAHVNNVQLGKHGRNRTNVWEYPGANSFAGRDTDEGNLLEMHPTVKPVALVADAILDASRRGGLVLDSFCGSGTTLMAAEKTGRICYGMELEPRYVDVAIRRWQKLTGKEAVHAQSGLSFNAAGAAQEVTHEQA
jgi:DNA modification methylase